MRTFVGLEAGHLSETRVRRALRRLIECAPDLTVVGEAWSTPSATRLDLELLPDVVVLDLLP